MKRSPSNDILESVFCANPRYELVLFDRLPPAQRELLKDFRKDPDFYGLLRPLDESGLGVKSVSRDIALLYLTLKQPDKIPGYVRGPWESAAIGRSRGWSWTACCPSKGTASISRDPKPPS